MSRQPLIAIVDDDSSFRAGLESLVRSLGHRALGFGSAESFLANAAGRRADCIISDIHMPGMSGIDLKLRLEAEGHGTPIILVTAGAEEHVRSSALNCGVVGFLPKPFDPQDLIDCLARVLPA